MSMLKPKSITKSRLCSERRTKVIDDDMDYYSIHSVWLSPKEKEVLKKRLETEQAKKHASRLDARFTLDFAGKFSGLRYRTFKNPSLVILFLFCGVSRKTSSRRLLGFRKSPFERR